MEYSVKAPLRNLSEPRINTLFDKNTKLDSYSISFQLGRITKIMDDAVGKFLKRYLIISAELEEMKKDFVGQAAIVIDYIKLTRREIRLDRFDDYKSGGGLSSTILPYCPNYELRCLRSADSKLSKSIGFKQNHLKRYPLTSSMSSISPIYTNANNNNSLVIKSYNKNGLSNKDNYKDNDQLRSTIKGKKSKLLQEGTSTPNANQKKNNDNQIDYKKQINNSNNNLKKEEEDVNSTKRLTKKAMRHFMINNGAITHFNPRKHQPKREEKEQKDIQESIVANSTINQEEKVEYSPLINSNSNNLNNNDNKQLKDNHYNSYSEKKLNYSHSLDNNPRHQRQFKRHNKEVHFSHSPIHYSYEKEPKPTMSNESFIKAINILSKSPLLTLNDRLKLCSLNEAISTTINPFKLLNDSLRSIEQRISELEMQRERRLENEKSIRSREAFPSKKALINLNFLTKEKEYHLIYDDSPINKELFCIICECLCFDSASSSSMPEGYNELFETFKVKSLKSLFIAVIFPMIFNHNNQLKGSGLLKIIHSNRELISQSIGGKLNKTPFACIAYSLDEIYQHLLYMKNKEREIVKNENEILNLKMEYNAIRRKLNRFNY